MLLFLNPQERLVQQALHNFRICINTQHLSTISSDSSPEICAVSKVQLLMTGGDGHWWSGHRSGVYYEFNESL
jgi:hypothetical protein